jgi:hypothetical protein
MRYSFFKRLRKSRTHVDLHRTEPVPPDLLATELPAGWRDTTVDLLLEEVPLEGAEELFGLCQGQPKMLDALMVLVQGDDVGDGLFITLIVTHDTLQFDTHTGASPGSSDQ